MMGTWVNDLEKWGCILETRGCRKGLMGCSWGSGVSKREMSGCKKEMLVNMMAMWVSSLD